MADSYSQIYIQIVFAVKYRKSIIAKSWRDELFKYITGIVENKEQKLLAIGGVADHIHILIGMKPTCCLSDLVREIKKSSNAYIKENNLTTFKFQWQEGFGAFSYGRWDLDNVIKYVLNQESHHKKITFKEEYYTFLEKFEVEFNEKYIFEWIDDESEKR